MNKLVYFWLLIVVVWSTSGLGNMLLFSQEFPFARTHLTLLGSTFLDDFFRSLEKMLCHLMLLGEGKGGGYKYNFSMCFSKIQGWSNKGKLIKLKSMYIQILPH